MTRSPHSHRSRPHVAFIIVALALALVASACGSDDDAAADAPQPTLVPEAPANPTETASEPTLAPVAPATPADTVVETRASGLTVTVQQAGDVRLHSVTAPEEVFANSTHIIETENSLVLIDTQFLLPNAIDFRAYADSLGKPIDRVFITHEHPDHFLGSEAFADLDIYALQTVSDVIEAIGQAEVDEKQADFGDAIASTFVVPEIVEPGELTIDGVVFELTEVDDAEAETQLVLRIPDAGVIATGDIVYSGVHLILAGQPPTWTAALEQLQGLGDNIILPGHGVPAGPEVYDANIAWLAKAGELMGTATTADEFKSGLIEAFPELGMDAAIDFVTPFLFPPTTDAAPTVSFGECTELSTGNVAPLDMLQQQVPEGVTVLSLTAQGTVFEGSDNLGVLIARTLVCDEISVTNEGETSVEENRHVAHVGTPIDVSILPATPYNNDGNNGADFNNYVFGYYTDSTGYLDAMASAGIVGAAAAEITLEDIASGDCTVTRSVTVSDAPFAFNATGEIPDAACEDPVVPFIANWWSAQGETPAVLSNNIAGQAAIFIDTATTTITVEPTGQALQAILGADPVTVDAFGVIGLIPGSDDPTMTITALD